MESLHQLELTWILFIQSLGSCLAGPMQFVSLLGNEEFYLLVMPILYWSLDARLGLRVGMMLLLSNELSALMKLVFHLPRPYWIDLSIRAYSSETSFGLPSGHALNAAGIWGLIATSLSGAWGKVALLVLILLIGLSRIFLGVHFISDVLLGWITGGLLLLGFCKIERPIWEWVRQRTLSQIILLALGSAALLAVVIPLAAAGLGGWEMPEIWAQNALAAYPGNVIEPLQIDGAFTLSGTWFGLLVGAGWMYKRHGGYSAAGTPGQRILRYLVGLTGVFIFWYLLGNIFPREADAISYALRFGRYTLIGLWVTALAPLVFGRLGLLNDPNRQITPLSTR